MLKVVKLRLYPNREQQQSLEQSFGNCRWLWNYCLNLLNQTYIDTGKGLSGYEVKKLIPQLKKEYEWLSLAYSACLQQVCLNLGVAFNNFFEKRAKYPRFKSKHGRQSIQYPQNVKVFDDYLQIPKIGDVKAVIHRPIEGKIKTVTVSKNCSGQYFASVLFDDGKEKPKPSTEGKAIGIDVGLTHFCITSDGSKYANPRFFDKYQKNLKVKQQQLSRKQKGSNNRNKARKKVARVHRKITNCREDFLHKLSRSLVDKNQVIIVENLAVKNMMQWGKLAKAIHQVGWGMFMTMLKYKAEQEGKVYQEVDRFFPSSKTCHVCLNQVGSLPLDVRTWTCENCQTKHDRDINASINLRDEGLRILRVRNSARLRPSASPQSECKTHSRQTSGTGDKAYCPDVRRGRGGRKKSTTPLSAG
ncbi:MAG: RNA-guided endonuclease TnpB family protein [Crocosphaera sp.]|nr:RNA-guided endonuclease TnpB family protein [Crocosphaera sp.]